MVIGHFRLRKTGDFCGYIVTLLFQFYGVEFRPVRNPARKGPHYRALIETDYGTVDIGAAWERRWERCEEVSRVVLDSPALERPLHLELVFDPDGFQAYLVWRDRLAF